jgi:hypothetical protein
VILNLDQKLEVKINVFIIHSFSLIGCQFPTWYQNMVVFKQGEIEIVFYSFKSFETLGVFFFPAFC